MTFMAMVSSVDLMGFHHTFSSRPQSSRWMIKEDPECEFLPDRMTAQASITVLPRIPTTMIHLSIIPLFLVLTIASTCSAMPSVLLKSGDSHCVEFEAAQDTVLRIDYEALWTRS
jgi:hypothetical protein